MFDVAKSRVGVSDGVRSCREESDQGCSSLRITELVNSVTCSAVSTRHPGS